MGGGACERTATLKGGGGRGRATHLPGLKRGGHAAQLEPSLAVHQLR